MKKRFVGIVGLSLCGILLAGCGMTENTQGSLMQDAIGTESESTEGESTEKELPSTEKATETENESVPITETVTITATGDCALGALQYHGYSKSFHQYYDQYGENYFFENFSEIFAQDDITIVNLECVLTDETQRVEKQFNIKGYPHYAGILSGSSVEVCSLGNNHTKDYGLASFEDTKEALEAVSVDYAYEDKVAYYETAGGIKVAMLSAHLLSEKEQMEPILMETLEKVRKEADLVIVSCHWGTEGTQKLTAYQKNTAHKLIDAGADLVIGHHPHVLQGVEYYQGKIICYSLGNFSFGANRNPGDKNTAVFQQTFTFVDGELTMDLDARLIPARLSGLDNANNYQPVIATGTKAQTILDNMRKYSAPLSALEIDAEGRLTIKE